VDQSGEWCFRQAADNLWHTQTQVRHLINLTPTKLHTHSRSHNRYPYSNKKSGHWKSFSNGCDKYYIANKWNGMNILFFKYTDSQGRIFVTGKSKGSPTIIDTDFGS